MKANNTQLSTHLNKCKNNEMLPVYLVSGDEPLQLNEACDKVRQTARKLGFTERLVLHVEASFDWDTLLAEANTLSLFSEQRLIELRIPGGKPGAAGSKAIVEYLERPPEDTILLIVSGKIDAQSCKSKWFKHIDKAGLVCQIWPIDIKQIPDWIGKRLSAAGLIPGSEAIKLLADRTEGNLLAAVQEIEKLSLYYGNSKNGKANIGVDEILACVSDNSRHTVFDLTDAALAANPARTSRILESLRGEGVEPVIILWALSKDIRELGVMRTEVEKGAAVDAVLKKHYIWEKRKPLLRNCLQQRRAAFWQGLLVKSGHVDRVMKGAETGNIWDELLQLSLLMAGVNLFKTAPGSRKTA